MSIASKLALRVLSAALSVWRKKTRRQDPPPDELRRDIGLDPKERRKNWWDY